MNASKLPSNEKRWLQYYPEPLHHFQVPHTTLTEFMLATNKDHDAPVVEYYGTIQSLNDIYAQAEIVAKGMAALGVKEGDRVSVFLQMVPEYLSILFAAEMLGVVLVCRDDTPENCNESVKSAKAKVVFAADYLSKEEEEIYCKGTPVEHIVLISPYTMADRSQIPDYVDDAIQSLYPEHKACRAGNMSWEDLLALGEEFTGEYKAEPDADRPLYRTYTSGSTGPSKQIIHSGATISGAIAQLTVMMTVMLPPLDSSFRSLHTILPPALIGVLGPMVLMRIASGALLLLDPFCRLEDIDLEFARYQPNAWSAIPQMADVLIHSKRLPEDFSMKHVYQIGGGADPMNNKQLRESQKFITDHGSMATFTMGYGMSEAGGAISIAFQGASFMNRASGAPLVGSTVGIFKNGSHEEVGYNEIGEICNCGPGNFLGYDDEKSTRETLQLHEDGKVWLHSGDYGYMDENGVVYTMHRGLQERFGGGYLMTLDMENRVVDLPGIKDAFFVLTEDDEHEGHYEPYMLLILEEGVTMDDVQQEIYDALEPFEYPVETFFIKKREYYHFKTNRRILAEKIARHKQKAKSKKKA